MSERSESLTQGFYAEVHASEYHADPCPEPSLSSSVARVLIERSPAHARLMHPRLNKDHKPQSTTTAMQIGSAVHSVVLDNTWSFIEWVDAANWRTKAARAAKSEAEADGRIPLLIGLRPQIEAMVSELRPHLPEGFLPEVTLVWKDHGIWCRARADMLGAQPDRRPEDDALRGNPRIVGPPQPVGLRHAVRSLPARIRCDQRRRQAALVPFRRAGTGASLRGRPVRVRQRGARTLRPPRRTGRHEVVGVHGLRQVAGVRFRRSRRRNARLAAGSEPMRRGMTMKQSKHQQALLAALKEERGRIWPAIV